VAAEVAAAVEAVKGAKPIGSELCLDTVRRLRQLLSNYDEPPLKEAVQGGPPHGLPLHAATPLRGCGLSRVSLCASHNNLA
jgi:hypothetical protein